MIFSNARLFLGEEGFVRGSLSVRDGRFAKIAPERCLEGGEDLQGLTVLPGLVDLHIHGCMGQDFSDGKLSGLLSMGKQLARRGITAFCPTSMTLPMEALAAAFKTADEYAKSRPAEGARMLGIHMEGPYFSEKKKGAQNRAFLRLPDAAEVLSLQGKCSRRLLFVDVAPELPGAEAFIREISKSCRVSIAHTNASYEEAIRAFDAGASHITHLFNGMPELLHRKPGVVGAAYDRKNVTVELIGDGLHNHPSIVRMAFALFPGRVCLVSDALRCMGMPDGIYGLGGQKVFLAGGEAHLADGTLAGASTDLFEDLVRVIRFGVPEKEAILAATRTPAMAAGAWDEIGSLEEGKYADFIVCDADWRIRRVYVGGKKEACISVAFKRKKGDEK